MTKSQLFKAAHKMVRDCFAKHGKADYQATFAAALSLLNKTRDMNMKPTYYGPKTKEECIEDIRRYKKRIEKRPDSAARYLEALNEAKTNLKKIESGMTFSTEKQAFI